MEKRLTKVHPRSSKLFGNCAVAALVASFYCTSLSAEPSGGAVVSGAANIFTPEAGADLVINQTTDNVIVEWQNFNIDAGELILFEQPDQNSIALNRVLGPGASMIDGAIEANGNIFIINGDGIVFGEDAIIDVNSLLAATMDIDNGDFAAGDFDFSILGSPDATIVNRGEITAATAGMVAFVAPNVANEGIIGARLGTVTLAAGEAFTLDFFGDSLVVFAAVGAAGGKTGGVDVKGAITAEGGAIYLTATAARDFVETVINAEADLVASSATQQGGKIILSGADNSTISVDALLDASGLDGGEISIAGGEVFVAEGAMLIADGWEPAPIALTWTLQNAGFGGADTGTPLTGSFVYTAETNTFSDIQVFSGAGATLPGTAYIATGPLAGASRIDFVSTMALDIDGAYRLDIGFNGPMTNVGGTLNAIFGSERLCLDSNCAFPGFGPNARGLIGSTSITASPEAVYEGSQNGGQITVASIQLTEFAGLASVEPGPENGTGGDVVISSDGFLVFTGEALIGMPPREGTLTLVGDPPPPDEEMDEEDDPPPPPPPPDDDEIMEDDPPSLEEMQMIVDAVSSNNSEVNSTGEQPIPGGETENDPNQEEGASGDVIFNEEPIFETDGNTGGGDDEERRLMCLLGVSESACSP